MLPFARRLPGGFGRLDNRRFIMVKLGSGGVLPPNTGMERLDCSMQTALVIMAAGLGSRFGGVKQMEGLGPHGEILMEYAAYDAVRAGYDKIVVVVAPGMRQAIDERFGGALLPGRLPDGTPYEVEYAVQDNALLPSFYAVPPERTKPFGTGFAAYCARSAVGNRCFSVINADDFYGADAFVQMHRRLTALQPGEGAMVAYRLRNTVSPNGTVSRGICTVEDGCLRAVREALKIRLCPDGQLRDDNDPDTVLPPDTPVSMNMWGFRPEFFAVLEQALGEFLRSLPAGELRREFMLPTPISQQIALGSLQVQVARTDAVWTGVTYQEDRAETVATLARLHQSSAYPPSLRL